MILVWNSCFCGGCKVIPSYFLHQLAFYCKEVLSIPIHSFIHLYQYSFRDLILSIGYNTLLYLVIVPYLASVSWAPTSWLLNSFDKSPLSFFLFAGFWAHLYLLFWSPEIRHFVKKPWLLKTKIWVLSFVGYYCFWVLSVDRSRRCIILLDQFISIFSHCFTT